MFHLRGDGMYRIVTCSWLWFHACAITTLYKVRGAKNADLAWTRATSSEVDISRDGGIIGTIDDDGVHAGIIAGRGGGSYEYVVSNAGTNTCRNAATAIF